MLGGDERVPQGLGCGDPVALAELRPGQVVLDLGSGGGLDCLRAAEAVGSSGRVIGVDMTPEMIARARKTTMETTGVNNVEFRLGEIENLPVADGSVDVVISNCVLSLCPDKDRAFQEAFRVLRPGGRLALCDVLLDRTMPQPLLEALGRQGASLEGAVDERGYVRALEDAGFVDVRVERAYPKAAEAPAAGTTGRARLVVQVAETGEQSASLELPQDVDITTLPRSFNGRVTAAKPDGPGDED
jgi:SAM-dependent methyltransferase